jgi:hypothetical protein
VAGDLPIIISAPHGGSALPAEIPDRSAASCGGEATTVRDTNTEELAREIGAAFSRATGRRPHLIINRLHRRKLDANRAEPEAACGADAAVTAFREFHAFIDSARVRVLSDFGRGWFTDLHGHGHPVARLELGYLLSASQLRLSDAQMDASTVYENGSSIRAFSQTSPLSFSALLRGPASLGALLEAEGYRAVPGSLDAAPAIGEDYFSGGYNTQRWGCASGGELCGVQLEAHFGGVRDTASSRAAFAAALVRVYLRYLRESAGIEVEL